MILVSRLIVRHSTERVQLKGIHAAEQREQ
jgi:hypothetical protein